MSLQNKVIEKTLPKAGEELGWVDYTWSPITKSSNGKLVFHEDRLKLPSATWKLSNKSQWKWIKSVLVCPDVDLFAEPVDDSWLEEMYEVMFRSTFTYIALTKEPEMFKRLSPFPDCGIGFRISNQAELMRALAVMVETPDDEIEPVFLLFDSLGTEYQIPKTRDGYSALQYVQGIVVKGDAAGENDWRNVESLLHHARKARCEVFFEPGMLARPTDHPMLYVLGRKRSFEDKLKKNIFCNRIKAFEEAEKEEEQWNKFFDSTFLKQSSDDVSGDLLDDVLIDDIEGLL